MIFRSRAKVNEFQIKFSPQPDITVLELATLASRCFLNMHMTITEEQWETIDPTLRRHLVRLPDEEVG